MSRRNYAYLLLMILSGIFMLIPSTTANVPPPIEYVHTESGGLFSTATNVSMPDAAVNVTIHLSNSWNYRINVSCSFSVSSQTQQNLTTAFVYPRAWQGYSDTETFLMREFCILVNDSIVNHAILHFDEFKDDYDFNQTNWEKVDDCDFALFNFSIDSNESQIVDVTTDFEVTSYGHTFVFEYIVDTARGWEGDTHEIVHFEFDRELDTEIIEYRQYPNESLVYSGTNYTASMTWDFHISNFPHDRMTFFVQQREYPEYNPIPPPIPFPWISTIVFAGAIVLVLVILKKAGRI